MKIQLLTGSLPPNACGVGDYTARLGFVLQANGWDVEAKKLKFSYLRELLQTTQQSINHLQYPSQGFRKNLLPQFFSVFAPRLVLTLHERKKLKFSMRCLIFPLLIFSKRIIVTTEDEYRSLPNWVQSKTRVIPVFSPMMPTKELSLASERQGVCFFGLSQPSATVLAFFDCAQKLRSAGYKEKIAYFSAVLPEHAEWLTLQKKQLSHLEIEWNLNWSLEDVSSEFVHFKFSYLFFPDGLSNRRSSFMALLQHGILVLSNLGDATDPNVRSGFIAVTDTNQAVAEILKLSADFARYEDLHKRSRLVALNYSISNCIQAHEIVYRELVET